MDCRVGRTTGSVVQLRLESECLEGRRPDHDYRGPSQRRPKDDAHSQNREPERARVDRRSRGAVGSAYTVPAAFNIFQVPGHVLMIFEAASQVRYLYTRGEVIPTIELRK
jgi:hypothetical protein